MMQRASGLMIGGFLIFIVGMGLLYGEPAPDPIIVREEAGGAPIAPDGHATLAGLGTGELDAGERTDLQDVREQIQESHALLDRLHDREPLPVLASIRTATGTHLSLIDRLMDRYGVEQENTTPNSGPDDRAATVDTATAALRAAARAQERSIAGLDAALNRTSDPDARLVYRSLRQAAGHQLHALERRLAMHGATYEPDTLTEQRYRAFVPPR